MIKRHTRPSQVAGRLDAGPDGRRDRARGSDPCFNVMLLDARVPAPACVSSAEGGARYRVAKTTGARLD